MAVNCKLYYLDITRLWSLPSLLLHSINNHHDIICIFNNVGALVFFVPSHSPAFLMTERKHQPPVPGSHDTLEPELMIASRGNNKIRTIFAKVKEKMGKLVMIAIRG